MESNKYIINSREVADMIGVRHDDLKKSTKLIIERFYRNNKNIKEYYKESEGKIEVNNGGFKEINLVNFSKEGLKIFLDHKRKTPNMQPLYDFYNEHSTNQEINFLTLPSLEDEFFDKLKLTLEAMGIEIELQKHINIRNNNYRLDGYISEYNLVIEYDEKYHKFNKKEDLKREKDVKSILNCNFIRLDYEENDNYNIGLIMKKLMDKNK